MNAMSDDSPKPTKPWEFPDDITVREFVAKETEADVQVFSLERICENSLGFYMVSDRRQTSSGWTPLGKYSPCPSAFVIDCHVVVPLSHSFVSIARRMGTMRRRASSRR